MSATWWIANGRVARFVACSSVPASISAAQLLIGTRPGLLVTGRLVTVVATLATLPTPGIERRPDACRELLDGVWLFDEVDALGQGRSIRHGVGGVPRRKQHGRLGMELPHGRGGVGTTETRHDDIAEDQFDGSATVASDADGGLAILGDKHVIAELGQDPSPTLPDRPIVFDQEDRLAADRRRARDGGNVCHFGDLR